MPVQGAARETAIVQNVGLVNNVARRFQRRVPPCVTFDDLVSAGMIGLIQAPLGTGEQVRFVELSSGILSQNISTPRTG